MAQRKKAAGEVDKKANEGQPEGKPSSSWRSGLDFIGVVVVAVMIALVIKAYVFDVYLIPSGSMETALHGRPDGGDRILCSKLHYRFRDLKRWEVAVFEFPYISAKRNDPEGVSEENRGQNYVKRVIGLPNETIAISKGDIWFKPDGVSGYTRAIKPDSIQRGMWLNVYEEDFTDLDLTDFKWFWETTGGGEIKLKRHGGSLTLAPGNGELKMVYRPRVPAGLKRDALAELPGIPDRYTLEQPVQFKCRFVRADGQLCGKIFVKTFKTQNMLARCPACGNIQTETSAIFYHRRSGLTTVGPYRVDPAYAIQGEVNIRPRESNYHLVPDLRTVIDLSFPGDSSWFSTTLLEDSRYVQAVFFSDGRIELLVNGATSRPEHRAVAPISPGSKHRIEFYIVEGTARVFVDSSQQPLLDVKIWNDRRPSVGALPWKTGVTLNAGGGDVILDRLAIDRDIFYYSGWETPIDEKYRYIGPKGEAYVNAESFYPMGDHCPSSYDARSWGPVPLANLRGPALLIWWPPERARILPSP